MDWKRPIVDVNLDFEFETLGEWEYVMLKTDKKIDDDDDAEEEEDDEEAAGNGEDEPLDMPPPWSPKLFVDKAKFVELCPKGEKTTFYKKCKVEFYADCK